MTTMCYVTIEGSKQGKFKGESLQPAHRDQIEVLALRAGVSIPLDPTSGLATGKHVHRPVTFVKALGGASPEIFNAAINNESLKQVSFEFMRIAADGSDYVYHTITLQDASVSAVSLSTDTMWQNEAGSSHAAATRELEEVSLTFRKIEIENHDGKTRAIDNWGGQHALSQVGGYSRVAVGGTLAAPTDQVGVTGSLATRVANSLLAAGAFAQ